MHYTSPEVYQYISSQTNDPIVERKTCHLSWATFAIYQSDSDFYKKISPTFDWITYDIPTPTLCPEERQRRRLMFRNERKLYKRKCDATGETIVSIYSPEKPHIIYNQTHWWTDNRSPFVQKMDLYSWNFIQTYQKLLTSTPLPWVYITNSENSDYWNHTWNMKNCYLVSASRENVNCYYWSKIWKCKNTVDLLESFNCENSYQLIWSNNCHSSKHIENCVWSSFLAYCKNCTWCNHCYCCNNLQHRNYSILNKQYEKKEYEKIIESKEKCKLIYKEYKKLALIKKSSNISKSDVVYGDRISHAKNCIQCYNVDTWSHCKYCENGADDFSYCIDGYWMWVRSSYMYEIIDTWLEWYMNIFCITCHGNQYVYYCSCCYHSSHLFWCVWLRNASYCIFNIQYTKHEYETLVPKIIAHMQDAWERWEFFDASLSPFWYNETVAQEYFPLTRDEALKRWYTRQDNSYDPIIPPHVKTLSWDGIPRDMSNINDDILKSILICESSWRPFRIIKQELEFYRKHSLPLPRKHPDVRHAERLEKRPWRSLFLRSCDGCHQEMLSVYPKRNDDSIHHPNDEVVLCEDCYQKEVFA